MEPLMRTFDQKRFRACVKVYCLCFVALVGLYVVIDAFTNLDEFFEASNTTPELVGNIGHFYLAKMTLFHGRFGVSIGLLAAIFTVVLMTLRPVVKPCS